MAESPRGCIVSISHWWANHMPHYRPPSPAQALPAATTPALAATTPTGTRVSTHELIIRSPAVATELEDTADVLSFTLQEVPTHIWMAPNFHLQWHPATRDVRHRADAEFGDKRGIAPAFVST
jgi:hypothetical protein